MDKNEIRAENISLICLLRTLKKNLWMIVAAAAIFAMLVSLYADFVRKPVYRASMTYAVTSRMSGYSTRNITAAKELASILTEVLDNRIVNDTIRASSEELRGYSGGIKAKLVENSNFVVVTSESGSQREAFLALVALRDNFDTISDYISSNIVAQVIQEPRVSSSPVNSMNVRRTAMKAALIGAVLMAAAIVAISVMSETVQTRSGAKSLIDAPVIAMLGHEKGARKKKRRGAGAILINSPAVSLAYTEQINSLCSRIEHEKREKGGGIVLVTSVGANEGKSTVAANIAISLASRGYKVALIDADLRNPSQTELFGGRWSSPLPFNKMLAKPFSVEALNTCAKYDVDTNVMMLFSQYSDERCTELLSSETMRRVEWKVSLAYGDDVAVAKRTMLAMLESDKRVLHTPDAPADPFVALSELADSAIVVVARTWTLNGDYWDLFFDMNERFYNELPQQGLHFPFPQLDVHLDK